MHTQTSAFAVIMASIVPLSIATSKESESKVRSLMSISCPKYVMNIYDCHLSSQVICTHSISGQFSSCFRRIFSMSIPEYWRVGSNESAGCSGVVYVNINNFLVSIVIHLPSVSYFTNKRVQNRHTSSDKVELPHPSIRILASLSGISSRIRSAMSAYFLNQSKVLSSDSLKRPLVCQGE